MSSGITLSAATRQNLLSLQDTASLLSTTQNRLSTGKKVNSALDNPVNFFTASALTSRSAGLSNLLDGISNGIQTIQAANKGITGLTKLTDQLKSTAQQALSASSAVTSKANLTTKVLNGAVDTNLLSTGPTEALSSELSGTADPQTVTGTVDFGADDTAVDDLTGVKSITIDNVDISLDFGTINTKTGLTGAINTALTAAGSGVRATYSADDELVLTGGTTSGKFSTGGTGMAALFGTPAVAGTGVIADSDLTGSVKASALGFAAGDSFTVNGASVNISKDDTLDTLAQKVVSATKGEVSAKFDAAEDKFTFKAKDAKTAVNLANGTTATSLVSNLGFTTTEFAAGKGANGSTANLANAVLSVTVGEGDKAKTTALTFGTGIGQVSTLDQLNTALASANAQASIDSSGKLSITTSNDAGSQKLAISGSSTEGPNAAFLNTSAIATVGGDGLTARNKLVNDYNDLLTQIDQLSNDSGFNGVNLLRGDQLKIDFNEDQTSTITVKGKSTNAETLGLKAVTSENFKDNSAINEVFSSIRTASETLKSQSSTFASNLSVVQNRQDFSKNIINVLDTGASNLTNADLNEEAANSQALSTRNSLAISALSLANQAQQGILQLLR